MRLSLPRNVIFHTLFTWSLVTSLASAPAFAQSEDRVSALAEAFLLPQVFEIMSLEGEAYGAQIDENVLQGRGGATWTAAIQQIYDSAAMEAVFMAALQDILRGQPAILDAGVQYATSDAGRRPLLLEVDARRAMLDANITEVAEDAYQIMQSEGSDRLTMLTTRIDANELIEQNVALGLNGTLAYFQGYMSALPEKTRVAESAYLTRVWQEEAAIRLETEGFLYALFSLAYQPLSDEELQAYIDFNLTDAGQAINTAFFSAFDGVFSDVSRRIGREAALRVGGADL
jgi:hypothetical protein